MEKIVSISQIVDMIDATYQIKPNAVTRVRGKIAREVNKINKTDGRKHKITESQAKRIILDNHDYLVDNCMKPMLRKSDIEWLTNRTEEVAKTISFNEGEPYKVNKDDYERNHLEGYDIDEGIPEEIIRNRISYPDLSDHIIEEVDAGICSEEELLKDRDYSYGTLSLSEDDAIAVYARDELPALKAYKELSYRMKQEALFDRFFNLDEELLKEDVRRLTLGHDVIDNDYIEAQKRVADSKAYIKPIPKEISDAMSKEAIKEMIDAAVKKAVDESAKKIGRAVTSDLFDIVFTAYGEGQRFGMDTLKDYAKRNKKKYTDLTYDELEEDDDKYNYNF